VSEVDGHSIKYQQRFYISWNIFPSTSFVPLIQWLPPLGIKVMNIFGARNGHRPGFNQIGRNALHFLIK
jgi:hypothetical protein